MQISVVIPTYNRARTLKECLEALFRQDIAHEDFEIIVVDDGSTDDTRKTVEKAAGVDANVHYHHQKNSGQGIARNLGISHAKGKIIVLIGDDIIATPSFLSEHMRYHLRHEAENEAVLGFTEWHPHLTLTPFMKWLTNGSSILGKFGGHQFAYEKLEGKESADYNFFYTSNISLKRSLLVKHKFDPIFSGYGWEDIELGYRLQKEVGLKLFYNKKAVAWHDHAMDESGLKTRMRNIGKSAWVINDKYPELKKVPGEFKRGVFRLLANPVSIWCARLLRNVSQGRWSGLYYYALSKKYFIEGLNTGRGAGMKSGRRTQ
jgi:glycosyltransferase involved in cell wall biosynthesis